MCVRECARRACGRLWVRARAYVMLRMCLCMHVRLQVRAGVHAGMRACAYINRMYDYYYAAQWVAGVRTCMYVCEHSNVYVYVCAGACAIAPV